jgi:photosystem II stability/assembly factor-like uncharacterized protein
MPDSDRAAPRVGPCLRSSRPSQHLGRRRGRRPLAQYDDGGQRWNGLPPLGKENGGLTIHGIAITPGEPKRVLVTTPEGIWSSADEGRSWVCIGSDWPARSRGIHARLAVKIGDPDVIFVGNGNVVFGDEGEIQRSTDGGQTWAAMRLSSPPNSTVYGLALNRADPDVIIANTLYGYLYMSLDGGDSWRKLRRELSEIRATAWLPNT